MKKQMGRPILYTKELAQEICDEISSSSKGLSTLCVENSHWPSKRNILRWTKINEDFCHQYAIAKKQQVESLIDDIIEIADDSSQDFFEDDSGKKKINLEHINRSKLRIDTRKWIACKLVPKIYGDRTQPENVVDIVQILRDLVK